MKSSAARIFLPCPRCSKKILRGTARSRVFTKECNAEGICFLGSDEDDDDDDDGLSVIFYSCNILFIDSTRNFFRWEKEKG